MNQTVCKRFIRWSPSVRGSCHVDWLSALPTSVLDVVAEDWPEVAKTTVDVGKLRLMWVCVSECAWNAAHRQACQACTKCVRHVSGSRAVGKRPPRPKYPI
jgi:hypothetical protein